MSRQTVHTMQRQDLARELRITGLTWQQVADTIDPFQPPGVQQPLYGSSDAARAAARSADARHAGTNGKAALPVTAEERRALLWDRYELIVHAWQEAAIEGDADAAGIVTRAAIAQSRLYGLNLRPGAAPAEHAGEEDDPVDDIARKRAERQARRATSAG